ncbi:flagellar export chaperone FlgN [Halonatronum saccharophilum]|uniref:flagellar export chaperone FlgN n=1 Tax=Halonatronum saccharophilum TaxID=150060 RepID=UPI0004856A22|nr:flagellar export chaperone FlgN [Halonatronum saccharophilum]
MKVKEVVATLESIYQKELSLYDDFLSLTKEQSKVIKKGDLNKLERLLAKRQKIIENIEVIEEKVKPLKDALKENFNLKSGKWLIALKESEISSQRLKDNLTKIIALINDIQEVDKENQSLLRAKQETLSNDLKKVKKGSKVNRSYNTNIRIHSTYIDNKR